MLTVVENKAQEDAACSLDKLAREGARRMLHSAILPPDMRRSPKVSEVLPVLYLRRVCPPGTSGQHCDLFLAMTPPDRTEGPTDRNVSPFAVKGDRRSSA